MLNFIRPILFYPNAVRASEATAVRVEGSQEANGINFALIEPNNYAVSGTVMARRGTPVAGATVIIRNRESGAADSFLSVMDRTGGGHSTTVDEQGP